MNLEIMRWEGRALVVERLVGVAAGTSFSGAKGSEVQPLIITITHFHVVPG
jgi:hypothetical protein